MGRCQRVQWYQKPIFLKKLLLPPPFLNVIMCGDGYYEKTGKTQGAVQKIHWERESSSGTSRRPLQPTLTVIVVREKGKGKRAIE